MFRIDFDNGNGSIELFAMGLLAALILVLAMPLFFISYDPKAPKTAEQVPVTGQ